MAQFCSKISPNFWREGVPPLQLTLPPTVPAASMGPQGPQWPCHSFQDFFQRTTGISDIQSTVYAGNQATVSAQPKPGQQQMQVRVAMGHLISKLGVLQRVEHSYVTVGHNCLLESHWLLFLQRTLCKEISYY